MSSFRLVHPEGEAGSPSGPRMLVITYHFPPSEATGGVRWEAFARRAAQRGWGVDVVALDPTDAQLTDFSRLSSLPNRIRVFGVEDQKILVERLESAIWRLARRLEDLFSSGEGAERDAPPASVGDVELPRTYARDDVPPVFSGPRALLRVFWALRSHFSSRAWARRAADAGLALFEPGIHRVVVSSGPPHLAHWGALRVALSTDAPLVLDFRDAWSVTEVLSEELASPITLTLASCCESECVSRASLVVANTEPLRDRMRAEHPDADCRMIAVPNGFDQTAIRRVGTRRRFVVAYAGSIYLDRDPRPLMRAVAAVAERLDLGAAEMTLEFMGHVQSLGDVPLDRMAQVAGVQDYLRLHPPGTREEAMDFLSRASVLVSLPQQLEMAIPSKIFDYMQFDAWIVAQAWPDSASERLLRHTRAAVVDPDDVTGLTELLKDLYRRYAAGERPSPLAEEHPELSRTAQADRLLGELKPWMEDPGNG